MDKFSSVFYGGILKAASMEKSAISGKRINRAIVNASRAAGGLNRLSPAKKRQVARIMEHYDGARQGFGYSGDFVRNQAPWAQASKIHNAMHQVNPALADAYMAEASRLVPFRRSLDVSGPLPSAGLDYVDRRALSKIVRDYQNRFGYETAPFAAGRRNAVQLWNQNAPKTVLRSNPAYMDAIGKSYMHDYFV